MWWAQKFRVVTDLHKIYFFKGHLHQSPNADSKQAVRGCPISSSFASNVFCFMYLQSFILYTRKKSVTSEPKYPHLLVSELQRLPKPIYSFQINTALRLFATPFYIYVSYYCIICHSPNPQFHIRLWSCKPRWFSGT
jgi:hypothetical protein